MMHFLTTSTINYLLLKTTEKGEIVIDVGISSRAIWWLGSVYKTILPYCPDK